jgi:hypothetical protein
MGRTESKQVVNQGTEQSAADQKRAGQSYQATNKTLQDYSKNLDSFMRFGRQTYGADGEYMRDQNTLATGAAAAGANKVAGTIAQNAMRTGANTAGYASTVAEAQREGSRDLTQQLATADASRLQQLTAVNQYGVQASALPATVQASLYGTGTSGSASQLSTAGDAAKTPGFWDTFAPALAGAAGTAAAGFCPAEGSLIHMADGTRKPVEELKKGEWVSSPGTLSPPNPVLETPQAVEVECWEMTTLSGLKHCGSETHTIALATGGYAYMPELKGKTAVNEFTGDMVTDVRPIGKRKAYPIKLGGNHAYLADGIWILS